MGVSDKYVIPFYTSNINKIYSPTALLGFVNNNYFKGDLYDLSLNNWDINSKWKLSKKYKTIICTRCAYFAKDPEDFIKRCYDNLESNGLLYVDWGYGDHWRFPMFKVGWVKDGEHEYSYGDKNYLWSTVWDDSFLEEKECIKFENEIKKIGYLSLKKSVLEEFPSILNTCYIEKFFYSEYKFLTIIKPYLQMYIMVKGIKR